MRYLNLIKNSWGIMTIIKLCVILQALARVISKHLWIIFMNIFIHAMIFFKHDYKLRDFVYSLKNKSLTMFWELEGSQKALAWLVFVLLFQPALPINTRLIINNDMLSKDSFFYCRSILTMPQCLSQWDFSYLEDFVLHKITFRKLFLQFSESDIFDNSIFVSHKMR